ncbi:uncharacterized protein LOC143287877 [Babylonia areolata]|uniref:uncharacterized protein LOC143287877 n=1 Tax=Babylonia areolata TaxID=304850 RepID=UPI003FD0E51F
MADVTEDTGQKHHSVARLLVHVLSESVVPDSKDHSTVDPVTKDQSTVEPVTKDQSTFVTAFKLSVGFIIVVVVAVVVYFIHRRKKSQEETRQREEERWSSDSVQDESPIVPDELISAGETQELTSEVTESSADPSAFENESEVDYDNEYETKSHFDYFP